MGSGRVGVLEVELLGDVEQNVLMGHMRKRLMEEKNE